MTPSSRVDHDGEVTSRAVAFAAHALAVPPSTGTARRLPGGERHLLVRVDWSSGPGPVVVRVASRAGERERVKAAREAAVLASGRVPNAPRLHARDLDGRWFGAPALCVDLLPGRPTRLAALSETRATALGRVVADVHATDPEVLRAVAPEPTFAEYAARTWADSVEAKLASAGRAPGAGPRELVSGGDTFARVRSLVLERAVEADRAGRPGVVHGDLSAGNLVWSDDDPSLVDWEDVRVGDPAEDVAYLFGESSVAPAARSAFWRGYASRSSREVVEAVRARAGVWEPVVLLASAVWWWDRYTRLVEGALSRSSGVGSTPDDHLREGNIRFARYRRSLADLPS
ncbi:phosphotransferase family protein [Actinoalloteichus spitiensis]|uniref:phosphotransferase family protein n=1 Tax=Actinoalloteichus spitiensis TaxID=252394 RepID=UPI00037BB387|nr:aminoglycoside phosphotransferase family protein [Actinoalloteichus spitiensis]